MNVTAPKSSIAQSTMILILLAETAFFGTFLMSYLFMRTGGTGAEVAQIAPIDQLLAALNTVVLLLSVGTMWRADAQIRQDRRDGLKANLAYSLVLGGLFIVGQIVEFAHSGMAVNDTHLGGIFFALIGFHALHVIAGMTVLIITYSRAKRGDFTAKHFTSVQMGAWFWYYVAAVWCILFVALFLV
ncbi:MAG: cytochrome c oxidase subunit 3 [Chloroflexota bacterium]